MDVDDINFSSAGELEPAAAAAATLDFALPSATFLFLQRIGIIPSTNSELNNAYASTYFSKEAHSTVGPKPLVPAADAILLLSTLPPSLLPSDLPYPVTPAPPTPATRRALLDALARLALEPSLTVEVMRRYRPLSVHLWGRWLEMLGLDAAGEWCKDGEEKEGERVAVEKVFRAMVRVLGVYENVFPCVLSLLSSLCWVGQLELILNALAGSSRLFSATPSSLPLPFPLQLRTTPSSQRLSSLSTRSSPPSPSSRPLRTL